MHRLLIAAIPTSLSAAALGAAAGLALVYAITVVVLDRYNSSRPSRALLREYLVDLRSTPPVDSRGDAVARGVWDELQAVIEHVDDESDGRWYRRKIKTNSSENPQIARLANDLPHIRGRFKSIHTSGILAIWRRAHVLERRRWLFAPSDEVHQRLVSAGADLDELGTSDARELAKRIAKVSGADRNEDEEHALLDEALRVYFAKRDDGFASAADMQAKAVYLVEFGLLLVVALALGFHREQLFLFGALGGLLSRLTRILGRNPVATDYGASAASLMIAPVMGALAGFAGIAALQGLGDIKVTQHTLASLWSTPSTPLALTFALAFGFVERLLDKALQAAAKAVPGASTGSNS